MGSLGCYGLRVIVFFFFFFQAEDGIRDVAVTGVQTCALPIFGSVRRARAPWVEPARRTDPTLRSTVRVRRSEERSVEKECRSQWSPYHSKKKNTAEEVPTKRPRMHARDSSRETTMLRHIRRSR